MSKIMNKKIAIRIAELWQAGKAIDGDEDEVRNALLEALKHEQEEVASLVVTIKDLLQQIENVDGTAQLNTLAAEVAIADESLPMGDNSVAAFRHAVKALSKACGFHIEAEDPHGGLLIVKRRDDDDLIEYADVRI